MISQDIEKLEQADSLMFDLNHSKDPKGDLLKVGQLLKEIGMLEDADNLSAVVDTYNQNARDEITKALRKKMGATVDLNLSAIQPYLSSDDDMIADLAKECLDSFKQYGQIVMRFNNKKATWKAEKSGEEFRQLFNDLDKRRSNIHNNCIDSIAVMNRLISHDNPDKPAFATWDNPNIKNVKDVSRIDIGNAILKQYIETLMQNDENVLKQLSE
ncbi:MAG: DUF3232 domain-containing protein [Lactobacillus sp.]